jgi:oligopeptide/dipeptide ABC transporter ATP-binding protein
MRFGRAPGQDDLPLLLAPGGDSIRVALPSTDDATRKLRSGSREPLLRMDALCVSYALKQGLLRRTVGQVRALDAVDLRLLQGQTTAVVGEAGAGKTTLARSIAEPKLVSHGRLLFEGKDLIAMRRGELRALRKLVHWVSAAEPPPTDWLTHVRTLLAQDPKLLVFDGTLDALAENERSAIVSELRQAQDERGLTCLVLTAELRLATSVADEVAILLSGRVVETGSSATLGSRPQHPYTQHLVSRARAARRDAEPLAISPPPGCRFRDRCPHAFARCSRDEPELFAVPGGTSRCFLQDPAGSGA